MEKRKDPAPSFTSINFNYYFWVGALGKEITAYHWQKNAKT